MKPLLLLLSTALLTQVSFSQNFLDPTFSDDGKTYLSLDGSTSCVDIATQSDGKIIACSYHEGGIPGAILSRLNVDGSIDTDFGIDGHVQIEIEGTSFIAATNIQIMPDDRIVVGLSTSTDIFEAYYGVARFLPDGDYDLSLDGAGYVLTAVNVDAFYGGIYGVAVQPDGKIISYGTTPEAFNDQIVLFRLNENGSIDSSFGNGVFEYQQFTIYNDYCVNMKFHDDHIYLIGHAMIPTGGPLDPAYADVVITKLNMDGSPDLSFGIDGVYTNNFSDMGDEFVDIVFLEDNSILAVGYLTEEEFTFEDGISDVMLCKITPQGNLDTTFGSNGIRLYDYDLSHDYGVSIFMNEEEKVTLTLRTTPFNGYSNFAFIRVDTSGELDTEFGVDGKISVDLFSSLDDMLVAIPTSDGKILAAGTCNNVGNVVHGLVRICPQEVVLPGVEDASAEEIGLYPNPCEQFIYMRDISYGTYRIIDYTGKLTQQGNFEQGTIPVQRLSQGLYILQIMDTDGGQYVYCFEKN